MHAMLSRSDPLLQSAVSTHGVDFRRKFLPDRLALVQDLDFLQPADARLLSQVQGRTYANLFALLGRGQQDLFRHIAQRAGTCMPPGYVLKPQRLAVASVMDGRTPWAVLALTLHVELASHAHCRHDIGLDPELCPLWKNLFLARWMEGSFDAAECETAWRAEHARLDEAQRDAAVQELVAIVAAADGFCHAQAAADADYFLHCSASVFAPAQEAAIRDLLLKAYRWQYIVSGTQEPRFAETLVELVTPEQLERIGWALAPILAHASA